MKIIIFYSFLDSEKIDKIYDMVTKIKKGNTQVEQNFFKNKLIYKFPKYDPIYTLLEVLYNSFTIFK